MSLARPACEPQLFSAPVGSADLEFGRVLRTSDPGLAVEGPLTFLPAAGLPQNAWLDGWRGWVQTVLSPSLAPALLQASLLAARGCAREMMALDRELDAGFEPAARERSRQAGRCLLASLAATRGERWLAKLQSAVTADQMPGHFAVIYAGQHALFHMPLRLLVPAYAYWEWSGAMSGRPPGGQPAPGFAGEADALRLLAQTTLASLSSIYAVQNLPAAASDR